MWEGVGDRTELQHIDPHSIGHNRVSFPFFWAAQPEAWWPSLSGTCSHSSVFSPTGLISKLIWSPTATSQSGAWGPTLLGAGFLSCILCPTGLMYTLTDFLSSPSYIIVQRPLLLVGTTIALIQPIHSQGYNSDIPRPDAPVIYIGAFPILTVRPGRRSIYNILSRRVSFPFLFLSLFALVLSLYSLLSLTRLYSHLPLYLFTYLNVLYLSFVSLSLVFFSISFSLL